MHPLCFLSLISLLSPSEVEPNKGDATMKSIVILCLLCIVGFFLKADDKPPTCFVVVGDKTIYCDAIQPGKSSTKIQRTGMPCLRIPTSKISAYQLNGRLFERLPVITGKDDTSGWAFMQYLATKDGCRLYRFCSNCIHFDPSTGIIDPPLPVYRYYVFRKGKFVSVTNDKNVKAVLMRFGIKQIA